MLAPAEPLGEAGFDVECSVFDVRSHPVCRLDSAPAARILAPASACDGGLMNKWLWLWAAGAVLATAWPARAADVFEQNQQFGRGVNIIGYDPIWKN
jgi:hypothetical protein